VPFKTVRTIACRLHDLLDEARVPHLVKTSGLSGLHVYIRWPKGPTMRARESSARSLRPGLRGMILSRRRWRARSGIGGGASISIVCRICGPRPSQRRIRRDRASGQPFPLRWRGRSFKKAPSRRISRWWRWCHGWKRGSIHGGPGGRWGGSTSRRSRGSPVPGMARGDAW